MSRAAPVSPVSAGGPQVSSCQTPDEAPRRKTSGGCEVVPEANGLSLHKTCQIAQKGLKKKGGGKPNHWRGDLQPLRPNVNGA